MNPILRPSRTSSSAQSSAGSDDDPAGQQLGNASGCAGIADDIGEQTPSVENPVTGLKVGTASAHRGLAVLQRQRCCATAEVGGFGLPSASSREAKASDRSTIVESVRWKMPPRCPQSPCHGHVGGPLDRPDRAGAEPEWRPGASAPDAEPATGPRPGSNGRRSSPTPPTTVG